MLLLETTATVLATGLSSLARFLIMISLTGAALLLALGRFSNSWGHWLTIAYYLASFTIGALLFSLTLGTNEGQRVITIHLYDWTNTRSWNLSFGMLIDQLSILSMSLITGVGSLIHIYSIGHIAHDEWCCRFFAYLDLSIVAMFAPVLTDSCLVLFPGRGSVGLTSYLLISFWQHKPSVVAARRKVFVVNRADDLGMPMVIFTMLSPFGSTVLSEVNAGAPRADVITVTLLSFLLLLAACGEPAQMPLQSWLLDAMGGPTPVSVLVHAVIMITAGIYLVVCGYTIYEINEATALAVTVVGVVIPLAGTWIGTARDDIKKVLAGPTMLQIGHMALAAGLGPVGAALAIFHLITHGFLKTNMFLGVGSVMHGMSDDVDMRNFEAPARAVRRIFLTFTIGHLAIIGFLFTVGYYSKDHIIEATFERNIALSALAFIGTGITVYYMTHLVMMTFLECSRWEEDVHSHESPTVMTTPLVILVTASLDAGLLMNNWIQGWLAPATGSHPHETDLLAFSWVGTATLVVVVLDVVPGWWLHNGLIPRQAPRTRNPLIPIGRNSLYGGAINTYTVIWLVNGVTTVLSLADQDVADGLVYGSRYEMRGLAGLLRKAQDDYSRTHGLTLVIGAVILGVIVVFGQLV